MNYTAWLPRTVHYATEDDEGEDSVCVWGGGINCPGSSMCVCVCGGGGVGGINCPGSSTMPLRMMRVRIVCVCVWGGGVGGRNCPGSSTTPLRMMRVRTLCVCVCVGGGWRYKLPRIVHYTTEDVEGEGRTVLMGGGGG